MQRKLQLFRLSCNLTSNEKLLKVIICKTIYHIQLDNEMGVRVTGLITQSDNIHLVKAENTQTSFVLNLRLIIHRKNGEKSAKLLLM